MGLSHDFIGGFVAGVATTFAFLIIVAFVAARAWFDEETVDPMAAPHGDTSSIHNHHGDHLR